MAINTDGIVDKTLPTRDQLLEDARLSDSKLHEFCNIFFDDVLESMKEGWLVFAVDGNGGLVGAWVTDQAAPESWRTYMRARWTGVVTTQGEPDVHVRVWDSRPLRRDESDRNFILRQLMDVYDDGRFKVSFTIDAACTSRNVDPSSPTYRTGIGRLMFDGYRRIVDALYVHPLANEMHKTTQDTWEETYALIKERCVVTLFAMNDDAAAAWERLGFLAHTEKDRWRPLYEMRRPPERRMCIDENIDENVRKRERKRAME